MLTSSDVPKLASHLYIPLSSGNAFTIVNFPFSIVNRPSDFKIDSLLVQVSRTQVFVLRFQTVSNGGIAVDLHSNVELSPSMISSPTGVTLTTPGTK